MIKFLEQGEIDRVKWDNCVMNSKQKLVYSFSWYLDMVSPGWCGLVEDDYKAVMALPVKRKYGFNIMLQPLFTQQLGVYSPAYSELNKIMEFIEAVPKKIRLIDYNFNFLHDFSKLPLKYSKRVNYELKLNVPYENIESGFTDNTRRNLKRSFPFIDVDENVSISEIIKLRKENAVVSRNTEFYEWLNLFMHGVLSRKKGFIAGAWKDNQLIGAAFFLICNNRIYYLVPVSDSEGKKHRAMFAILDYVINKYADTGLILDFEGSGIKGIARFFAGFGARPVNYFNLRINRLPFYLKIFKK